VHTVNGSDLRSRRLRLGLSRDALAHQIGVPTDIVTEWEVETEPIGLPSAVEQVLRRTESERDEHRPDLR
jgi:DNA-binding transcriptional regulator YiaG